MSAGRQFPVPLPASAFFTAATPANVGERASDTPAAVIRRRRATANLSLLGDRLAPARFITLNLFADVTYVARFLRVERVDATGYAWIGDILGVPGSRVVLAAAGDALTGAIDAGAAHYSVHPDTPPDRYYIDQIDTNRLPRPR